MSDYAELIARVEAALEGVTPGKWEADTTDPSDVVVWAEIPGHESEFLGNVGFSRLHDVTVVFDAEAANARFIAAARQDVPDLLAALKAVMAKVDPVSLEPASVADRDMWREKAETSGRHLKATQAKTAALRARVAELEEVLEQMLIEYDEVDLAVPEPPSLTASVFAARAALRAKAKEAGDE